MKKLSAILATAFMTGALFLVAGPAHAALQAAGATNAVTTIPNYYLDLSGRALAPCLDQNNFCVLPPEFDPLLTANPLPITTTGPINDTNFPAEVFYFLADAQMDVGPGLVERARLRIALEAAFAPTGPPPAPTVAPNNGATFLRINLQRMAGLTPNSTYTVTHPYGTFQFATDAAGDTVLGLAGQAFRTEDPFGGAVPGLFDALLPATTTNVGPFLVSATGPLTDAVTGNRYIGNPNLTTAVTGSPTGNNLFRITGPNIGGAGVNTIETTLFALSGKMVGFVLNPATVPDFGVLKLAAASAPKTINIRNLSGAAVVPTVTATVPNSDPPVTSSDFSIVPSILSPCGATLAAGASCNVDVVFSPTTDGAKSATITIADGTTVGAPPVPAPSIPPVQITVSGTGDGVPPALALDPGQANLFTKTTAATISGTASDANGVPTVQLTVNGTAVGAPVPATNGVWSFNLANLNQDAINTILVTASDSALPAPGNQATVTSTVTSDTILPVVGITSPAAGLSNNPSPTLTFTATDTNLATTAVKVDGTAVTPTPATLGPLADGAHTVAVDALDSAGNLGTASVSFSVDATPPVIAVTSPKAGINGFASLPLTFTADDANPDATKTVVRLDTVVVPAGTTTLGPFAPGVAHTLTVDATDLAGNASPTTTVNFTVILADGRVVDPNEPTPTISDALVTLRHVVNITALTPDQFAHADVAPLDPVTGVPVPNGIVDIADALVILRKVVGLITTF